MLSRISCPVCGRVTDVPFKALEQALKCPDCGEVFTARKIVSVIPVEQPPSSDRKFFVGAGIFLGVCLALLGLLAFQSAGQEQAKKAEVAPNRPRQQKKAAVTSKPVVPAKIEWVTPQELLGAYRANAIAADQAIKDRVLGVTGTVRSIGEDLFGTPYVALRSEDDEIACVQCVFDSKDTAQLAKLRRGQDIRIIGTGSGKFINVILRDCRIVGVSPP